MIISFGASVLFAISDEIHQFFVPGRGCEVTDMIIDSIGGFIGVFMAIAVVYTILKIKNRKNNKELI